MADDVATLQQKLASAKAKIRRMKRRFKHIDRAVKFACRDKGYDLHWLGRRNVSEVVGDESHPSHTAVVSILRKYKKEGKIMRKGDWKANWEAGFWSGVCSTGRLFADVAFSLDAEEYRNGTEADKDRAEMRNVEQAWEEFPMLDS